MRILGIATGSHDSGIAIIKDGVPEIVIEEERLNREKRTSRFPEMAIKKAFETLGIGLSDIDAITTPWNTSAMRWQTRWHLVRRFPISLNLLRKGAVPTHGIGLLYSKFVIKKNLQRMFPGQTLPKIEGTGHHDAHAAFYYVSPFEDATILVMDGYGDNCSTSVYVGNGNELKQVYKNRVFDSIGMIYSIISNYLGFAQFGDEGKVMGLSAYGNDTYLERMKDLVHLHDDGTYSINMSYFSHDKYGYLKPFTQKFYDTFGPASAPKAEMTQRHMDLSYALQVMLEDVMLHVVNGLAKKYPSKNLVLSGGVAMNCVATARIIRETDYDRIWLPPCASDTGVPLGSAIHYAHHNMKQSRGFEITKAYYGLSYSDTEIEKAIQEAGVTANKMDPVSLIDKVSDDLQDGKIIAWFQGGFEMGPRALGNRSILADPRRAEMKATINARVKYREAFRPFAPAVLYEHASEFFEINQPDPFMTIAPRVRPEMADKIPAVVHVDNTARFQTVEKEANPPYYKLIEAFGKKTGVPILLNTSFNKQEPIVASPAEAISCFLRTEMDILVLGNYYITDRNQPAIDKAYKEFGELEKTITETPH